MQAWYWLWLSLKYRYLSWRVDDVAHQIAELDDVRPRMLAQYKDLLDQMKRIEDAIQ